MTTPFASDERTASRLCARCGTELAPRALVCPACQTLVHADRLTRLASEAEAATRDGRFAAARAAWDEALPLLPATTQQHAVIVEKLKAIAARMTDDSEVAEETARAKRSELPFLKRFGAGLGAIALLVLTKGKFLLLGLTKLPTFFSMFAFFGLYWAAFGWPLALGLVVSIYIHEMGHVAAILRLGMRPSAPMFVPGLGAFVSYSRSITDPREDAMVGLAGPIWGAAAGVGAFAMARYTGSGTWLAIAQLTGWLNLFNLLPVFGLDGSHGFKALNAPQRWAVAAAFGVAWYVSGFWMLIALAAVAVYRAVGKDAGPGDARTLANFLGLIGVLSWMATLPARP